MGNHKSKLESIKRVLKEDNINDSICDNPSQPLIHDPIQGENRNSIQMDLLNNLVDNSNLNIHAMKQKMHIENIIEVTPRRRTIHLGRRINLRHKSELEFCIYYE